jgi:hypothetical protein
MNIFILSEDPVISANFHADQHLHKMILESAQLLSTCAFFTLPAHTYNVFRHKLYKPAYPNHPCNIWLRSFPDQYFKVQYLYRLAAKLDDIRQDAGSPEHSSLPIANLAMNLLIEHFQYQRLNCKTLQEAWDTPGFFTRAMPAVWKLNTSISTPEAYQKYYCAKHDSWVRKHGKGMTYHNRLLPSFLSDHILSKPDTVLSSGN